MNGQKDCKQNTDFPDKSQPLHEYSMVAFDVTKIKRSGSVSVMNPDHSFQRFVHG